MSQEHRVIIVPGLDGRVGGINFVTRNWPEKYDLHPVSVPVLWKDGEPFAPKLKQMLEVVDEFIERGDKVSLIGTSAGGSGMGNVFIERKDVIYKMVNVGGFMRPGAEKGRRSLDERSASSPAFKESVLRFAKLESTLTAEDRKKILTARPLWDELVPQETVVIEGALNTTVPMIEHVAGLAMALVRYDPVIMFLKGEKL